VTFGLLHAGAPLNHPLIHQDIITNLGCLADDHSHAVVNEEPAANSRSRMYLDSGQKAVDMGEEATQKEQPASPEKVGYPMQPDGVQTGIAKDHLPGGLGSRVFSEDGLDILSYRLIHFDNISFTPSDIRVKVKNIL
jgi:hypothetical protein